MRLIQFIDDSGRPAVGVVDPDDVHASRVNGYETVYELARRAIDAGQSLASWATRHLSDRQVDYVELLRTGRVQTPLQHPDPAHCLVTGTGLTHLGSAATRDVMHQQLARQKNEPSALTDSMKIFQLGVEQGQLRDGRPGAQPEWFYKGTGEIVVAPGANLPMPDFALDGGEEPELVGLYLIDDRGTPRRLGFALGNEFSDHVTERQNYLYLAHSKLRHCAIGPELRVGDLPADLRGSSRIRRAGQVVWEKPFLTGEANMCHSLDNLEYHHFKYAAHRRPGDVHLHFFGTATLSFADGVQVQPGDAFEIDLPALGAPLSNVLEVVPGGFPVGGVHSL